MRAVEGGSTAEKWGVVLGDEVVAVAGGPGSGMPSTAVQVNDDLN